jgi:hypothetical protein
MIKFKIITYEIPNEPYQTYYVKGHELSIEVAKIAVEMESHRLYHFEVIFHGEI